MKDRPACPRQKSAGGGKGKAVKGSYRRTPSPASKDSQFVPQHDNLGFLPLV